MIGISNAKRFIMKTLVITFLITITTSATSTAQGSQEDLLRQDMKRIAEAFASYAWLPVDPRNIKHSTSDHIDTPDADTVGYAGWWHLNQVNLGVPYFWGGSTAIRGDYLNPDANLGLDSIYANKLYFDQLVAFPKPAGNINTIDLNGDTNGVDCVGFINNVWRMGIRAGMAATSGGSRPIRFEDLKLGDVLLRYVSDHPDGKDHVILFEGFAKYDPNLGFVDYDPPSKLPIENQTMIKVYEASKSYGRVHEAIWIVRKAEATTEGTFQTHKLTMQRLAARVGRNTQFEPAWRPDPLNPPDTLNEGTAALLDQLRPRTFIQPRDVVIVMDTSLSVNEAELGKEAQAAECVND